MNSNVKYRVLAIVIVILVCIYGIIGIPSITNFRNDVVENWKKNIKLGTDLKGGSQLILQIQLQDAFKSEADSTMARLKDALNQKGIEFTDMTRNDPQSIAEADQIQINVRGVPNLKAADFRGVINEQMGGVWILNGVNSTDYRLTMKRSEALKLKQDTLLQTKNTIQKKVDGLGLAETSVQERGGVTSEAEIMVVLPGVDDTGRIRTILK